MKENKFLAVLLRKQEKYFPILKCKLQLNIGDYVIFESNRGIECGKVTFSFSSKCGRFSKSDFSIKKYLRIADEKDLENYESLEKLEIQYLDKAREIARQKKIKISIGKGELLFDKKRIIIYTRFLDEKNQKTSSHIKSLTQTLSEKIKCQVEIKDINERSMSQTVGGIGSCGRNLCCSSYLDKTKAVSVKMAKEQGLAINMQKLCGQCGKLKCCLRYEKDFYSKGRYLREMI